MANSVLLMQHLKNELLGLFSLIERLCEKTSQSVFLAITYNSQIENQI